MSHVIMLFMSFPKTYHFRSVDPVAFPGKKKRKIFMVWESF